MGIVALIAAIIGGIGFWWWRAQQLKGAADSVIDVAGKARGMISRARFRQRSGQSVLAGVYTVPGDGSIDFVEVFKALPNYSGWVVIEAEQDPAKAHPKTYATKGFAHLGSVLGALGIPRG